ncbi:hypothetical protein M378DRAFT_576840 [Amanita muscaria Koide BX008]|uniref:Uncharacterized protein n=1 Tax=Amanita muscaria (strain Koide BX008) TaxID=946122 RepID=A0A0C2SNW3_AMAMK|nr:hypothetical protein M378DRAFT_576840 [Amanita muscaria Koide BX008]
MFRFFQRLGSCNCCNPSTDILTAENQNMFATGQERLDSNTTTYGSHSFQNGTKHPKLASKSVTPQDSSSTGAFPCHTWTSN